MTVTSDWSDADFVRLREDCAKLGCQVVDMLGAEYSESGCRADAMNDHSSATGRIQFMADSKGLYFGYTRAQFAALGIGGQAPYCFRHFKPYAGRLNTPAAIYTAIFLPAFVAHSADPDYILVARGGKLGWAYSANAVFDENGDGHIQVYELERAIRRNAWGARWRELCARAGVKDPGWGPDLTDTRTTAGLQHALLKLGYQLDVDGVRGTRTTNALIAFQANHGLVPDGVPGPKTQAALREALEVR